MTGSGSKKILLVDYEVSKMKATEDFLIQAGFEVVKAYDGLDALEKFAEEQVDLVLLSAMLPKLHGFEVCKAIKQSDVGKKIPVLITTSVYKSYKYKRQAMKDYFADDYILKPFNYEELLIKIREHLGLAESEDASVGIPRDSSRTVSMLPDVEVVKPKKDEGRSFDKLLDETLETLLKTSEMDEISSEDEKKSEKTPERDLDSILEDTLSGLLRASTAKPKSPPAQKPIVESLPPESDTLRVKPVAPQRESGGEIDKIISDAMHVIETAGTPTTEEALPDLYPTDSKTIELPRGEIFSALDRVEKAASPLLKDTREGIRFGKYILIEKIASGGMAEMWKAKQRGPEGFEKIVAIKRILPHLVENEDFITMFIDEGKVAAQLTHPNIAQIYELGEEGGSYYIAMEYIAGKDLREVMRSGRRINNPFRIELGVQTASKLLAGLHYAHRKKGFNNEDLNIVHRDVSPANILISYEGEVKLVDFGIAKAAAKNSVTQIGALKGKILYMSPEQASGQSVDRRSDIFSVGVLLYEMITGKRPFLADNEMAILQKVREWDPTPPSSLNARISTILDRIILRAVAKNPSERYQTAEEFRLDLDSFLNTQKPPRNILDLGLYMRTLFRSDIAREVPELLESIKDTEMYPELDSIEETIEPVVTRIPPTALESPPRIAPIIDESPRAESHGSELEAVQPERIIEELLPEPIPSHDIQQMIRAEEPVPVIATTPVIDFPPEPEPEMIDLREEPSEVAITPPKPIFTEEPRRSKSKGKSKDKSSYTHKEPDRAVSSPPPPPVPPSEPIRAKSDPTQSPKSDDVVFDDSFLMPSKKQSAVDLKNPVVLIAGGIGALVVLIVLIVALSGGGDKQPPPSSTPTADLSAMSTPSDSAAIIESPIASPTETPSPTITPMATKTPMTKSTAAPVTVTPTFSPSPPPTPPPVDTPTNPPAPPTDTPVPTKIPAGTYIEHPQVRPQVATQVPATLPAAAKQMGVTGYVQLRVLISETGEVLDVEVLQANEQLEKSGCVKAAKDALNQWKFKPATQDGVPVKTHLNLVIPFTK